MKPNRSYFIIGMVLILVGCVFFFKNKIFNSKELINIKCNNNYAELSNSDIKKLNVFLKNEKLLKNNNTVNCVTNDEYVIEYNDYTLSFDNDLCTVQLNNNKTYENYQTTLNNELTNYVKDVCNRR